MLSIKINLTGVNVILIIITILHTILLLIILLSNPFLGNMKTLLSVVNYCQTLCFC